MTDKLSKQQINKWQHQSSVVTTQSPFCGATRRTVCI